MKPVSVRFKCFGPYMEEQYIDFRELEKNGIFLICGETGAGKTSILDAICYALYGRSSGGLRGDMSVMRCKLAGKNDETLVEFIFDCNGRRYKFTRSLKYGRKNLNDSHNCLELRDGEYVPIFENPKATVVNRQAEALIGLTYDQFRQVIILPQGQFEKLLVSNSEEKEKILVSLFHADRWQRMAEELYRRVAEEDTALKQEKLQIAAKLREYGCDSLDALTQKLEVQKAAVEEIKCLAAEAEARAAQCRARHDSALVDAQAFAELARREQQLGQLTAKIPSADREEQLLRQADLADRIRPQYAAYQEARRRKLRAEGQLAQKQRLLEDAGAALGRAQAEAGSHDAARPEQEERKKRLTLLESAGEVYRSLAEKKKAVTEAEKALAAAARTRNRAEQAHKAATGDWQTAMEAQNGAIRAYQDAQTVYLRGIGGILAEKLLPGRPCPVCGSPEHPMPAQPAQGRITEDRLEVLNRAVQSTGEAVSRAVQRRSQAEEARNQADTAWNLASQQAAVAEKDYENALERKLPGIDSLEQLEAEFTRLRRLIAAYESRERQLSQALQAASGDEKTARGAVESAREEWSAAAAAYTAQAAAWRDALKRSGLETEEQFNHSLMEPEDRQRRSEALIRFRTGLAAAEAACEEQREALADKTAPDMAALKKELTEAEGESKTLSGRYLLARKQQETMASDKAGLSSRDAANGEARIRVDADLEFANRLRGRSGVSLQRYVLGVMLTSVTAEANRLLGNVCSGRYRLYRTDEISGSARKGGLELEVCDSHNNQRRSVTTLSGGEKFLVALSLAIGLSTVVQAQGSGIRLEAMFIDEGFGSLDREAVNDALEVLQGIQRSSGVVGIISHVEQLAETIPSRIEITKGKNGSTCRCVG